MISVSVFFHISTIYHNKNDNRNDIGHNNNDEKIFVPLYLKADTRLCGDLDMALKRLVSAYNCCSTPDRQKLLPMNKQQLALTFESALHTADVLY